MSTFSRGDLVRKRSGSQWQGRIVGEYSTTLTPEGYAVESEFHAGSVQIYPAAALEMVQQHQALNAELCGARRASEPTPGSAARVAEKAMKEGKELYKKAEFVVKTPIEPCPVCGADAELWKYSKDFKNGPIDKVMMCSNGERFGPQDGVMNEGCLLYMPPQDFYRGRIAEAVKFWNEYAKALNAQRSGRNWKRVQVLREATPNASSATK